MLKNLKDLSAKKADLNGPPFAVSTMRLKKAPNAWCYGTK
jgi:hypothetical protein